MTVDKLANHYNFNDYLPQATDTEGEYIVVN